MLTRLGVVLALVACGGDPSDADYTAFPVAAGAAVDKVTWYQGVEKVLYNDTDIRTGGTHVPPVIEGRPGMLRVFVSPQSRNDWVSRTIAVVLKVQDRTQELQLTDYLTVWGSWQEENLRKTANFQVPAEMVSADTVFEVAIHEMYPWRLGGTDDVSEATWTSADRSLRTMATGVLDLHLVPIRYNGDGSGRLPDVSGPAIERLRERLFATYPVTDIDITVEPPMNWPGRVTSSGGWEALLAQVTTLREGSVGPQAYFYGLFNPASTFEDFCVGGCTAGLSNLAVAPQDDWARASIGLGYEGHAADTMIHELGHAHGRRHANCGGAADVDGGAYPGGAIVSWGYDLVNQELIPPSNHKDMMSYCDPVWVSDYTFSALADRVAAVGPRRAAATVTDWQLIVVSGSGEAELGGFIEESVLPGGEAVTVELLAEDGSVQGVEEGWFVPFDHRPGGLALIPPTRRGVVRAQVLWD